MCGTAGRACIVGNLWGDKPTDEAGRIYLRPMIERLCSIRMLHGVNGSDSRWVFSVEIWVEGEEQCEYESEGKNDCEGRVKGCAIRKKVLS